MKRRQFTAVMVLGCLLPHSLLAAVGELSYSCERDHRLLLWRSGSTGPYTASWGTGFTYEGKQTFAHCGFRNGRSIPLTNLALYLNRGEMANKNVWVYEGFGDHCSQGKLLLFNDQTTSVMIVTVFDYTIEKFKCERS